MVCRVGFCFDGPPPNFWPGGVRELGTLPAMPGRGMEPPLFIRGLSFPVARRGSCCAGLELCAPDGGAAGDGGIFLLCRGSAEGGRWVLRACFPAISDWEPGALVPDNLVAGGVAVPAMPGRGAWPPPFTGGLPFPEAWRCSCCAGLAPCTPDVGVAGDGWIFLLCRGVETEGRWVLRVPIPAVPG